MEKKDKVRFSIRLKIFLAIMGLSFTTLILLAYAAFSDLYKLENYAIESGDRLGESAMKDSEISLETLYKTGIRNKAIDVAKQLEIYLNDRPHMTAADLKADDRFREMANQVVGETGYTAVMDIDEFVFLVHQFFEYEDSDLTPLKSKLPSFWAVIETLRGGGPSSGYYDWQEPDGTISKKYAYIAPIKASTADGKKGLTLWATTYIWEFSRPVESTKAKIREAIWDTRDKITAQKRRMIRNIIGIFAAIIFIVLATSYALSRKITQPILALSNGVRTVGSGNLDVFLEVKTGDEIENLADAFNKMTGDLKAHIQSLNETTASKERIQSRLDVADTILKSLREVTSEILDGSDIHYSFEWLFPHMRVETFKKGDYLFHKGDKADKILYVKEGTLRLVEINKTLGTGALIGETGFLSPSRERTMSVLCEEDSEIYTMHEDKAIEIFHSDPSLVLKMIQLTVKRSLENLKITVAEKERIESDLRIARDIQASTLPHVFPPFPERKEIEIFASMQAAKEVGGDFYDFFFVDEDRLAFIIGDVSGKGVPAALFMMTTKILLKNEALRGLPADEILYHVNNILSPDNETSMFVTILCGILDTATGELQIGNAGHLPPLLCKEGEDLEFLELPRNFVLGPMEGTPFPLYKTGLHPGETLFFYTDGVTEAMNTRGEFFEAQRFKEVLSALKNNHLTEIIDGVRKEIGDFAEGAEQSDDITMLAVRFYGK